MTELKIKLGDAATFINGYAFKPSEWNSTGREIIRIQNLTNSSNSINYFDGILPEKYKVKKGDLLISWSATLGIYEWHKEEAWLNQHIFKVVFNKYEFDKRFFFHLISFNLGNLRQEVHGSTMKHITKDRFDELEIPLPPLETQKKIAATLDKTDELRQNDKKILEKYDQLTQSVFMEMFGEPVKNNKVWQIKPFSFFALIDTKMTTNFTAFSEFPHIGIGNIEQDSGRIQNIKLVKEESLVSGKYIFSKDHIIYSKIRPNLNKVALPDFDGLCSADAYPILVDKFNTNRIFFAYILRSKLFLEHILKHSQRTNIPKANKQQVESFHCIAPPKDMQDRFAQIVVKIEEQKRLSQLSLQRSEDLFHSLLQRAFRGELI